MVISKKSLFIGVIIALFLMILISADWSTTSKDGGPAVACSADGKTVYAIDEDNIFRSFDSGTSWEIITPKNVQKK